MSDFINRKQLGKKLGITARSISRYKSNDNEVYKKIKELFEVKKQVKHLQNYIDLKIIQPYKK